MRVRPSLVTAGAMLLAVGSLMVHAVHAAPATSEELEAASHEGLSVETVSPDLSPTPSPSAEAGVRQSTTVELLLQLQDRPNAPEVEPRRSRTTTLPRANRARGSEQAEAPAQPNPLLNLKPVLLGPGSSGYDRADARAEPGRGYRSLDDAGLTEAASPRPTGAGPRDSLLSHPVVRFIRENRVLTISASIAVLAGIWLTANYPSRRRR